jgi:hypothetical protein
LRTGIIAALVVVALVAAFVAYAALHQPAGTAAAGTTRPPVTASTSPPSAPPSSPAVNVDALIDQLQQTIQSADDNGSLSNDRAKSMIRVVGRIKRAWDQGDLGEFRNQCQQLRSSLDSSGDHHGGGDNGGDQGASNNSLIQTIDAMITQLLIAAGTEQH